MQPTVARTRRWSQGEYHRLADLGFFRGQRVELVEGRIIQMAPQKDVHAAVIWLVRDALAPAFGDGFWVRAQLPLRLGKWSEPEPDVSVVRGGPRDYIGTGHPPSALLIVEVSDSILRFDRKTKAGLYAKYGIRDYWIVNLIEGQVEVHRNPIPDESHRFGHRYSSIAVLKRGELVQPLATTAEVRTDDLLP